VNVSCGSLVALADCVVWLTGELAGKVSFGRHEAIYRLFERLRAGLRERRDCPPRLKCGE